MASLAILFSLVLDHLVRRRLSAKNFEARGKWLEVNKSRREAS